MPAQCFSPTWFNAKYVHGSTDLTVVFHLPPGVQPGDARYHTPSSNWPGDAAPAIAQDASGNITYTWHSAGANGSTQYTFGASFPEYGCPGGRRRGATADRSQRDHRLVRQVINNGAFWAIFCNVVRGR